MVITEDEVRHHCHRGRTGTKADEIDHEKVERGCLGAHGVGHHFLNRSRRNTHGLAHQEDRGNHEGDGNAPIGHQGKEHSRWYPRQSHDQPEAHVGVLKTTLSQPVSHSAASDDPKRPKYAKYCAEGHTGLRARPTIPTDEESRNPCGAAEARKSQQGESNIVAKEGRPVLAHVSDDLTQRHLINLCLSVRSYREPGTLPCGFLHRVEKKSERSPW